MIVNKKGKYKLLSDYSIHQLMTIVNFKVGTILDITQIDKKNKHVLGPELNDWVGWDMPVEPVEDSNG